MRGGPGGGPKSNGLRARSSFLPAGLFRACFDGGVLSCVVVESFGGAMASDNLIWFAREERTIHWFLIFFGAVCSLTHVCGRCWHGVHFYV